MCIRDRRKGESWRPAHRFKWFVSLEGRALLPLATLRPYLLQRGCGWGGRSSKGPAHLPALPRPCPFSLRPRGFSDPEPCLAQLLPREVTGAGVEGCTVSCCHQFPAAPLAPVQWPRGVAAARRGRLLSLGWSGGVVCSLLPLCPAKLSTFPPLSLSAA